MNSKILGDLKPGENSDGSLTCTISFENNKVEINLDPGNQDIQTTIALAENTISKLSKYDTLSKDLACKEYLDIYNSNWRNEQDEILTGIDFKNRIKLTAISFLGNGSINFIYFDDDLFWGHSIVVQTFDALEFKDTNVSLWG